MTDVYPRDEVISNGKVARPPKFYDQQFELIDPVGFRRIKAERNAQGKKHESNNTYDRLEVREKVQNARNKTFTRRDL